MIRCAACRAIVNGKRQVFRLHRHSDFGIWMKQLDCDYDKNSVEQGFIDWDEEADIETFVDRYRAFEIAQAYGLISSKRPLQELYSEDLW